MGSHIVRWAHGRPLKLFVFAMSALLLAVACSQEPEPAAQAKAAPAKKAVKAKEAVVPILPPEDAISVFDEKTFDPKMVRDPFKPFIRIEKGAGKAAVRPVTTAPRTPLERFSLEELKFVGILLVPNKTPKALVEDPTGKGYTVAVGTVVGNRGAKIAKIEPDQVMVEERVVDVLGEENVNMTTIKLHKPENEVNP